MYQCQTAPMLFHDYCAILLTDISILSDKLPSWQREKPAYEDMHWYYTNTITTDIG